MGFVCGVLLTTKGGVQWDIMIHHDCYKQKEC